MCKYGSIFLPGTYAKNVKCMYTSATGHIADCNEFI